MTVGELIALLSEHPQDLRVYVLAGADIGEVESVDLDMAKVGGKRIETVSINVGLHGEGEL